MKNKIPNVVRIGPYDWEVELFESHAVHGITENHKFKILLEDNKNKLRTLETLVHEIKHAICTSYHIEITDEEEVVTRISAAWTQVYRDNPELVKFIGRCVK